MSTPNFQACPPGVIEVRPVGTFTGTQDAPLWRNQHCRPDRWHYTHNPCNCYAFGRQPSMIDIAMSGRYQFRLPVEIRGTWRRDGRGIAATLANERKRIAEARVAFVLASAAVGPWAPIRERDYWPPTTALTTNAPVRFPWRGEA